MPPRDKSKRPVKAASTRGPAIARSHYKRPVFLSYPKPLSSAQESFIETLCAYLDERKMVPRTLGVTDYNMDAPLMAIRRLMSESHGLLTVAFRRTHISTATVNLGTDLAGVKTVPLSDVWFTSPWAHIEPAMAFQLGLPILVLREKGVVADGVLQRGVVGLYMPEFELDSASGVTDYLESPEWQELIGQWEGRVSQVAEAKSRPPQLYRN